MCQITSNSHGGRGRVDSAPRSRKEKDRRNRSLVEILHQPVDLHRLAILVVFTLGSTCCATLLPNPNPSRETPAFTSATPISRTEDKLTLENIPDASPR